MNQIIQQFIRIAGSMYYNWMLETVFWDVLADFIHRYSLAFFIDAAWKSKPKDVAYVLILLID